MCGGALYRSALTALNFNLVDVVVPHCFVAVYGGHPDCVLLGTVVHARDRARTKRPRLVKVALLMSEGGPDDAGLLLLRKFAVALRARLAGDGA